MPVHATRPARSRGALRLGLAAAAAAGLAGCGPDPGTPEGVTEAFVEAMAERDWEGACALLSHDLVHRSTDGNSQYCPRYLEQWHEDTSGYRTLVVQDGATATPEGHELLVAPEGAPDRTETVTVVEESGRLLLRDYPGRDTATR
ncbi:nuclear transport factor 2 family protein [Kocuria rosea]|jgi:hypothetical protein|uniref:nuclear transport factor 2 family protein n=1 Tax=Kocuria rosea TaxID=1275 RepID=UPI00203FE432|nr:nuclear transport factor 2 family protein [Kocuria rosea]MCM3688100.1 nuclear transport factor 2 family protein [Kocuria rosea]HST71362.1 nuclear transport factor 2 family protein [Kocuria rosea]